ncbi:hypothetical protein HDR58_08835 [bacterium]|nr:hypothetical protein [bacterium]
MKNIFKNIKYFFLSIREKDLQKKLKNTTKRSFTNKTSKTILSTGANVTLNTQTQKLIELVKNNVSAIVKKTNGNPDEILNYIKAANTPVYRIQNADKLLNFLKEEEGFICEQRGFDAIYLSIITGHGFALKTPPMFVLREGEIEKFYMLHHFYRWFSMKSDLPGFEYEVQKKFKSFLNDNSEQVMKTLTMEDIISIQEAINRDQEATTFVLEYVNQVEGSQNVLDKIKNNGGADI